jgi:hypothetical protein
MPTSRLPQLMLLVALLGVLPSPARAQVEITEYDPRGVAVPSAPDKDGGPEGAILFGPRAVYLASIDPAGGAFGGVEFVLGGSISLGGPLSLVVRARVGSYATVRSPALELDDTACGGTWGFSLCFGDMDMLGLGVGGELGLRLEQRYATPDVGLGIVLGGELLASGTGYLDMFEHVREGGGLGGDARPLGRARGARSVGRRARGGRACGGGLSGQPGPPRRARRTPVLVSAVRPQGPRVSTPREFIRAAPSVVRPKPSMRSWVRQFV